VRFYVVHPHGVLETDTDPNPEGLARMVGSEADLAST